MDAARKEYETFSIEFSTSIFVVVIAVYIVNLIIHLTFKILVFRLIYKKGPLKDNPMNVLILAEQLPGLLIVQPQMIMTWYKKDIVSKYGQAGCIFFHALVFTTIHTIASSFVSGFAIACLRWGFI